MSQDIDAITRLVYSYAELFDAGDFDQAVGLFRHARVRVSSTDNTFELQGEAARAILTDLVQLHDGIPGTKHLTTNLIVDIDPDQASATARSYYTALQARPGFALQPILAGRWHDRFEKVNGAWRFSERVIHPDLLGDVTHHLATAP